LILAGYPREMENFLSLNPGLRSRFPFIFDFPDYDVNELMDIAGHMMNDRQYQFSTEAYKKLKDHFMDVKYNQTPRDFSNGRYVRNIIERSIRTQSMRLLEEESYERNELLTLTSSDIQL
jgi:stage V sporulation protein K